MKNQKTKSKFHCLLSGKLQNIFICGVLLILSAANAIAQPQISAGYYYSFAITDCGNRATGYNAGQFGVGNTTSTTNAINAFASAGTMTKFATGTAGYTALGIKPNGTVWGAGQNVFGQLGDGTTTNRTTPVQALGLTNIVDVATTGGSSIFLKSDGTVWACGWNGEGQLGTGNNINSIALVQASGLTNVIAVAAGWTHFLYLKSDGTVWGCGGNGNGQLGIGTTSNQNIPVQVSGLTNIIGIGAGSTHSIFLKNDGTVWTCGWNAYGQIGDGTTTTRTTAVQVTTLSGITKVSAGGNFSMALKSDGTVRSWGQNSVGQLGDGTTTNRIAPVQVNVLTGITAISAGAAHSLFVKIDGTIWACGDNVTGELGDGTTVNKINPVSVASYIPPAVPTGTASQTFCSGNNSTVANLSATGSSIKWYAAASGGSSLPGSTSLVNNTHYYATQTVFGCESTSRFDKIAIVNPSPAPTISASGPTTYCYSGSVTLDAGTFSSYSWSNGTTTQTITPPGTGTYTVTVTNSFACTGSASQPVIRLASIIPSVSASPSVICNGQSSTLSAGYSSTKVYNISLSNLINLNSACIAASRYTCSNTPVGFSWMDNGSGTVSAVQIQFSVGANCIGTSNLNTNLNGVAGPQFNSPANCNCQGQAGLVTLNPVFSGYTLGGTNTFLISNLTNCWGLITDNPTLGGYFAKVTVTYAISTTYSWSPGGMTTQNPTVSPANTTTYTATISVNGCSETATQTITVNPLPAVTASNVSGCAGSSIALSGSPAGGTWSVANPYTGSSATYTHTYTDGNGCTNTSSPATITVNALPTVTASNVSGCTDSSIALSGSPGGGTFSITNPYTGTSTTYTYSYTDGNGCSNTSSPANITVNSLPTVTASNVGGCDGTPIALSGNPAGGTYSVANPYSGSSATYTYSYTDGNGCSNTSASANITVNNRPTGSLSGTTAICSGSSATLSIAVTGSGTISGTLSPGAIPFSGTGSNINVNVSPTSNTTYTVATLADVNCTANAGDMTGSRTVNVNALPTASISNNSSICLGQPATVQLAFTGTGPWSGTISDGSSIVNFGPVTGSSTSVTVTPSSAGNHNFTVTSLSDANCGNGSGSGIASVNVSTAPPSGTAGTLTAPAIACGNDVSLISVNSIGGQNVQYSWNTGSGSGTVLFSNNINGPFIAPPLATNSPSVYAQFGTPGGSGYDICVQGTNGCGSTNNRCIFIRGIVSVPGAITPAAGAVACPNDVTSYSCGVSGGAAIYNWTLNGSTGPITAGQGTNSPTVTFPVGFTGGNLCVTAALSCGGSSTSAPRCMSISNIPAIPATITGNASVCPGTTGVSYAVPAVTGASGYSWSVPAGASISSGINTPSITVDFPASFTGASSVCVAATGACGISMTRCKTVSSGVPLVPAGINGSLTNICSSTVQYSIVSPPAGVTYTWTNPAGTTIIGGQGSSTIQMNISGTFNTGSLTVVATSVTCAPATSPARAITLFGKPATPSIIISFPGTWCNGGFTTFSVASVSPQPTNNWTVSNGTITAGQGSSNIDATWGTGTGTVSVTASNACGVSSGTRSQSFTGTVCREEENGDNVQSSGFNVYPNPAHDKVTVSIDVKEDADFAIQLTDVSGRVVFSENRTGNMGLNTYNFDISQLSKGIYMLQIISDDDNRKTKVVVE